MSKLLFLITAFSFSLITSHAQITLIPSDAKADERIVLRFDASQGGGELKNASKIYMHHGVVLSKIDGTDWNNVIGNWGVDDGVGEMKKVSGTDDLWEIIIAPDAYAYFGVSSNQAIYRISAVFRSADGNIKATFDTGQYDWGTVIANGDAYVDLTIDNYLTLNEPISDEVFLLIGEPLNISASSSSNADLMRLYIDRGQGFKLVKELFNSTDLDYSLEISESEAIKLKIEASINGEMLELSNEVNVYIRAQTVLQALPIMMENGVNYHANKELVTLALLAPQKEFVYVVGDFNNWAISNDYLMNYDSEKEIYWLELNGLTAGKDYVYQYWVDGTIKIGDPYAEQIADPYNDQYISSDVYPNLPSYSFQDYGTAGVFNTNQVGYNWSDNELEWIRPETDELVIYELLIRDLLHSHSFQDLIDTLDYIVNLGVNAIELMPINEFEGNESWGYNPSYYFAPDKYYGTKTDVKQFIDAAHQKGLAVILDMVLNHSYGQSPMVELYFDSDNGVPSLENPWYNRDYVGPFEWGYDFNHESTYTQNFIDDVNQHWLEEYHFDGYRFDFTKGFTNYAPNNNLDGYDQSRIDIIKRMGEEIWAYDPDSYIILEHWASAAEEDALARSGFKMWRNKSYDFIPAAIGNTSGTFQGTDASTHVSFFDSHDERRIVDHLLTEGRNSGAYNIKDTLVTLERAKMAAAFHFLMPGPKMMWMFDELGYDINIDFNGRVGNKPLPWGDNSLGYYEDIYRQYVYEAYAGILKLRTTIGVDNLREASTSHLLSGEVRRLVYNMAGTDLVVIGNFSTESKSINPSFTETGLWYDYFSGLEISIANINSDIELGPGEWHIYTSDRMSEGYQNVVEHWVNPVTITPYPFALDESINIRYNATKGSFSNTAGLEEADKVYIHSGIYEAGTKEWVSTVGNLVDDDLGLMSEIADNIWEISIVPQDYYRSEEINNIAMYFRDANNENLGKGFRGSDIIFDVESSDPFLTITPSSFDANDRITITFNAEKGNRELLGVDKVYMHSSVDITDTDKPQDSAWEHVVGNWGKDDGIGKMNKVAGSDNLWELSLTPQSYYGMNQGDHPYWLAAVFRSADGNKKGTGNPGELPNGFIHDNLDFFVKNDFTTSLDNIELKTDLIFPNPSSASITIDLKSKIDRLLLINSSGGVELNTDSISSNQLDISQLANGVYLLIVQSGERNIVSRLIKN